MLATVWLNDGQAAASRFAAGVLAHLKTQETRADPAGRQTWRCGLIKSLYGRGLGGEQVRLPFQFLDGMKVIPKASEEALEFRGDDAEFAGVRGTRF